MISMDPLQNWGISELEFNAEFINMTVARLVQTQAQLSYWTGLQTAAPVFNGAILAVLISNPRQPVGLV